MAVRMGQELELSKEASHSTTKYSSEDRSIRENVWGVSLILDLFLSLQLGRPSAVADVLKMQSDSSRSLVAATGETVPSSSLIHGMAPPPQPLFYHTVALCQIISRINFYLYLNFNMSGAQQSQSEKLVFLKNELDMWQHGLPHQYRISLGHQPGRDVLEVNMLYHVAVILLYRPLYVRSSFLALVRLTRSPFCYAARETTKYNRLKTFSLRPHQRSTSYSKSTATRSHPKYRCQLPTSTPLCHSQTQI